METDDLFGHHVEVGRPALAEGRAAMLALRKPDSRQIPGERVVPDINDMVLIIRPRNSPLQSPAADGNISQAALDEAHHFVAAEIRLRKFGTLRVELEQAILKGRVPKEIV